jgi:hypothetical protein
LTFPVCSDYFPFKLVQQILIVFDHLLHFHLSMDVFLEHYMVFKVHLRVRARWWR